MHKDLVTNRISRVLLFVGPLVSLAISPLLSYDPINPIKNLILCSLAFSILGMLIRIRSEIVPRIGWPMLLILISLLGSLMAAMLFSDSSLFDQFWGVFGRNNGFLSYFALITLFCGVLISSNRETYRLILRALQVTSIPMTFYCLIQIAGRDPFPWSAFAAFGTLGNVNFLSAFFGLSVLTCVYFFHQSTSIVNRLGLAALALVDIMIIWQTDSIQGLMMIAAGFSLLLFFWIMKKSRVVVIVYIAFLAFTSYLIIISFVNKGPLASLIYQSSITYRGDYMAAAWNIALRNPITGVGLDSYGDWYRSARGVVATFRTGYGRTTNVAHNVYLDMAANGGFILFFAYLILNLWILFSAIRALRRTSLNDSLLIYLFTIWVVFQIQSLVSIAQIGVSIWGWLVSGSLFGYASQVLRRDDSFAISTKNSKKPMKVTLDPASSILAFLGFSLGFFLAFLQFKADADYRSYAQKGDLNGMVKVTKNPATSAHFFMNAQYLAITNNYPEIARDVNFRLRARYPREISGWIGLINMTTSTEQERNMAKQKIEQIDPYFFCLESNYRERMQKVLTQLPASQQRELAFAWGVSRQVYETPNFSLLKLGQDYLNSKYDNFCS